MKPAEIHRLVYPYQRFDAEKQKNLTQMIEKVYECRDILKSYHSYDCADVISFSLRFIEEIYELDFKKCRFLDCLSYSGASAFCASAFYFKSVTGIEFCLDGFKYASEINKLHFNYAKCNFIHGSMQDYFMFDSDVVYIDCTLASTDSILNEGVLLSLFFTMCNRLLPGSFLIVITGEVSLNTTNCAALGFTFVECVRTKSLDNHNNADCPYYSRNLWILKTLAI